MASSSCQWQPNISPDIQRLTQQLDAANRTIDCYAHLIASLSAELKLYRDTVCVSCKERVLLAVSVTISLQRSEVPSTPPRIPPEPDSPLVQTPSVNTWSDLSSPLALSPSPHGYSTEGSHNTDSTSQSIFELPLAIVTAPVIQVDYNPGIRQTLDLSLVNTFAFTAEVNCVKFSRDGKYFAVGLENEEIHIYDVITMSKSVLVESGTSVFYSEAMAAPKERFDLWVVRFSPDNKYVATGGDLGQIKIWEVKRKRVHTIFNGHGGVVKCIDFSPEGRFLVSASYDHTIRMWRMRDGSSKCLSSIGRDFNSVAFSPDGRYVAGGSDDLCLRMWDSRTGQLLKQWSIDTIRVWSIAFWPDGKGIGSAGDDDAWKSWDLSSFYGRQPGLVIDDDEREVFTCKGHQGAIKSISFSPDGRWVVTSSDDCTSRIWDTATGAWVCTLKGHSKSIWEADFSPSGRYLVTGSIDCHVMLWRYKAGG